MENSHLQHYSNVTFSPYHLSYILRIMQVTSLFPNQVQRLKLRSGGLTNLTYFETFVYNSWGLLELPICCFHFLSICPIIFATIQVSPKLAAFVWYILLNLTNKQHQLVNILLPVGCNPCIYVYLEYKPTRFSSEQWDSNPHALLHMLLRHTCLPIPPYSELPFVYKVERHNSTGLFLFRVLFILV